MSPCYTLLKLLQLHLTQSKIYHMKISWIDPQGGSSQHFLNFIFRSSIKRGSKIHSHNLVLDDVLVNIQYFFWCGPSLFSFQYIYIYIYIYILPGSLTVRPWNYGIPKGKYLEPSFCSGELLNFGGVLGGSSHLVSESITLISKSPRPGVVPLA